MTDLVSDRDLNALAASALAQGRKGLLTLALVARARQEERPEHTATLEAHGWGTAHWRACLAEVEELCRRTRC